MTLTSGEDQLTSIKCEEADVKPLYEEKRDVARFIKAVKEGNGADLAEFEALFKNRGFVFEQVSVNPLLIVAAFGSSETVEYIHKWRSSGFDWNDPLEFPAGVFEGILDKIKDRKPTPLHITTFLKNQAATKSLIKYCDEQNIAYCMNNIQLSNSMEEVYMTEFAERLKREYSHLKPAVVPGHQIMENGTWTRVFVAYSPEVTRATNQTRVGIGKVMLRNPYKVDREAMDVAASKNAHCEISKQDMNKAKQAIESHSKTLWCDHSNLNIISISSVRSKREAAVLNKALCVVLYCSTKGVVPLGEKEFPTRLTYGENNFIDIDVREGYFEYGGYENDGYDTRPSSFRHEKLKMGCNIGVMNQQVQNSGGTLGPFVRYNGNTSFLTCAHVLFDVAQQGTVDFTYDGSNRIDVVQPALDTSIASGAACGFIQRAIFNPRMNPSIDMAVVTISDESRLPTKGRFANDHSFRYRKAGFKDLPEYNDGSRVLDFQESGTSNMVVQFGSGTHLSKGFLEVDGIQVRPLSTVLGLSQSNDLFCMSGQYEVEGLRSRPDFFMLGDSGAAVFMLNGTSLHCIGMAIGHTSTGNAVVTPIAALLDAVGANADIDLSVFP